MTAPLTVAEMPGVSRQKTALYRAPAALDLLQMDASAERPIGSDTFSLNMNLPEHGKQCPIGSRRPGVIILDPLCRNRASRRPPQHAQVAPTCVSAASTLARRQAPLDTTDHTPTRTRIQVSGRTHRHGRSSLHGVGHATRQPPPLPPLDVATRA